MGRKLRNSGFIIVPCRDQRFSFLSSFQSVYRTNVAKKFIYSTMHRLTFCFYIFFSVRVKIRYEGSSLYLNDQDYIAVDWFMPVNCRESRPMCWWISILAVEFGTYERF